MNTVGEKLPQLENYFHALSEEEKNELLSYGYVILQHFFDNTADFFELLKQKGLDIVCAIGKPKSQRMSAIERINSLNIPTRLIGHYSELDDTDFIESDLERQINNLSIGKKLRILDVGGYFLKGVVALQAKGRDDLLKRIGGIVEVTKFGHNRYFNYLHDNGDFPVPIVSIAESDAKHLETIFVTEAGWRNILDLLEKFDKGRALLEKKPINVGLIGYGMINQGMQRAISNSGVQGATSFFDINSDISGDETIQKKESLSALLKDAQIICSSTGNSRITLSDIDTHCQDHAILVAMGSRTMEFPVEQMDKERHSEEIAPFIKKYTTTNNKTIYLFYGGTAINYMSGSCTTEQMDPYFTEMIAALQLLKEGLSKEIIHTTSKAMQQALVSSYFSNVLTGTN